MSDTEPAVLVDRVGGRCTITMNRPSRLNAANAEMWEGLTEAFRDAAHDPEVRCVVLTGAGGAFCSGADLADGPSHRSAHGNMRWINRTAMALHEIAVPVIARVEGIAAGAGANLALLCDLILAADDARFCEIFSRRGLSVDMGGSWALPRQVGMAKAMELVLFADMVSAPDAVAMGLINRAVPLDELDALVDDWAGRLERGPSIALGLSKQLVREGAERSLAAALDAEAAAQCTNFGTKDTREAITAFLEKRSPDFTGR